MVFTGGTISMVASAEAGGKVPARQLPDFVVRATALFDRSLQAITVSLGRRNRHSTEKARTLLGWQPRPAREEVLDCADSLIAHGAVQPGRRHR